MLPVCVVGIALVAYLAATVFRDVYDGIPTSVRVSTIDATCQPVAGSAGCAVTFVRLNPGRFYLRTLNPAASLTVTVPDAASIAESHVILVRSDAAGQLTIDSDAAAPVPGAIVHEIPRARARTIIAVSPSRSWNRITFAPAVANAPVVVSELAFLPTDHDLLQSSRTPIKAISAVSFYATVAAALTLAVCGLVVLASWIAPLEMYRPIPWLAALLCFAVCILELGTIFSPYWSFDLRAFYGEELILSPAGGNLTAGLYEGSRIVQGLGQTIGPGLVQWHRMPGYGWPCALAALIVRTSDAVEIAMTVVVVQVLLYSAAVGLFAWIGRAVFGIQVAALLALLLILLPKQLNYTEVDSIIAPVSLTVLSTLLVYLSQCPGGGPASLTTFLLVNAALASWFVLRNDVLPGWIALSVVLAGRRWHRLIVPFVLIAAIAVPWALYKRQYRHEFNLMPTNAGEVLLLSLCEVPGAFPYACTDDGYFEWARRAGYPNASSQAASNLAVAEVVRHWVTYPVHFGFMVWFKLRRAVLSQSWPGFRSRLNFLYSGYVRDVGLFIALLAGMGVALAVNHARRRSLLLGWALFLNMPIFFLVFSSAGRFYAAAGVNVLVAAVPLLFEPGLYSGIKRHPWRAAVVIVCFGLFIAGGRRLEDLVLASDSLHYWTPFLDPHASSLEFVGH